MGEAQHNNDTTHGATRVMAAISNIACKSKEKQAVVRCIDKVNVPSSSRPKAGTRNKLQRLLQAERKSLSRTAPGISHTTNVGTSLGLNSTTELGPIPEEAGHDIVHTYSLPKCLNAYKKQKVVSEAERFDESKYARDNIVAAIHSKLCGVLSFHSIGFRGHRVPLSYLSPHLF